MQLWNYFKSTEKVLLSKGATLLEKTQTKEKKEEKVFYVCVGKIQDLYSKITADLC